MHKLLSILFIACTLFIISCSHQAIPQVKSIEKSRIDMLLDSMTLEEKVGQMNQYNGFWDSTGPAPSSGDAQNKYKHLKSGRVGSVLNVVGAESVRKMQETVVNETRLGIPLIFGFDVIHGHKTLMPVPMAEAASWDLEAIQQSARNAAIEASARGLNWTFAPMVDISRDARWGRVMEGAGEDPYLGSQIAKARVHGFQGEDLSDNNTIAACAKHFAAYGFSESGKDYNAAEISLSTLYNVVLPPFKACVDAGVSTFMNSFSTVNGIPSTADDFLQRDILKGKWGFEGFVVSDWASGAEMIAHGYATDKKDAAIKATNGGSDMDMESYANVNFLQEAVEEGSVSMEYIDDAVYRILKVKEDLGLFDDPYKYCSEEREERLLYHPDHRADARDMAKKSIVLLKNEIKILPISKTQSGLAVIGTLANDDDSPLGNWRMGSDSNTAVSVLKGLDNMGIKYKYAEGVKLSIGPNTFHNELQINETDRSQFQEAIELAKNSEVVLMVLGEHSYHSGEGRSRANIGLPGLQQELLEEVYAVNPNIVLVLMTGRPLVLNWAEENVPAILNTWQLGTEAGNAIADVLVGDYNPSGKLPMSFPRSVSQIPIYYNHLSTGRPGPKAEVFWSHYMDEKNSPLYPFGYGLSYTSFEYSDLTVSNTYNVDGQVKVSISLRNTGDVTGKEVSQLYIRDKVASVARPVRELKGFQLTELTPGESQVVEFILTKDELGFINNQGDYIVEPGDFDVFVGGSSDAKMRENFKL